MTDYSAPRRRWLKIALGLAAAPFVLLCSNTAGAVEMVSETDPEAVDLDYKADATQAKKRTDPAALCHNCKFYTAAPGQASGSCAILLPRKEVTAAGWCAAWIKQG